MINEKNCLNLGLLFVRVGVGIVFIIFGFSKFPHPENWLIFFPSLLTQILNNHLLGFTAYEFLRFQGLIELILGLQLLIGIFTRLSAGMMSVILALIIFCSVGLDETGIRDLGLLFCAIGIFFLGPSEWSVDAWLKKTESKSNEKI